MEISSACEENMGTLNSADEEVVTSSSTEIVPLPPEVSDDKGTVDIIRSGEDIMGTFSIISSTTGILFSILFLDPLKL